VNTNEGYKMIVTAFGKYKYGTPTGIQLSAIVFQLKEMQTQFFQNTHFCNKSCLEIVVVWQIVNDDMAVCSYNQ
jgi:hypothetical protein